MNTYILKSLFLYIAVIMSIPLYASQPTDSVYLEGSKNSAVILAHGKAKHPTWKVVDPLRKGINSELDFHTLSLQMPNEKKNWKKYANDFPKAYETINQGIVFLKNKGIEKIYLLGHSMGSRMMSAYTSDNEEQVNGLIILGCRNNGDMPLSCISNVEDLSLPILDVYGSKDKKDTAAVNERSNLSSDKYTIVKINGANHKFKGEEDELIEKVNEWLKKNN